MVSGTADVIIVTRDIEDNLKACLDSLKKQSYPVNQIFIIDNSLNEDFRQKILGQFPEIKLHGPALPLTYCEAINKGIGMSNGCFILCLNDDVVLDNKFIEEAIRAFDIDDKIGMVSGKILRPGGKIIDSTGLFLSPWRTARERGYGLKYKGQYGRKGYVFGVSGSVAFYRRKMLENIKMGPEYFDNDFRFFYEDLDIAWRANRHGWKGYYIPQAIAYHVRGATARGGSGINKPFARRYINDSLHLDLIKNRYLAMIKNESFFGFLTHLPLIALYDAAMWCYVLSFRPGLIKQFISKTGIMKSAFDKRMLSRRR
ncbi:MAG: glycosyltransferase [Candidatus Omnitrophica bacterium]|nr:glycosyltransferase [Candidatus Omnitrophota bacterium]MDD5552827.1 glycosyltransferase [Candidatus Omnitrophota bacterium]